MEKYLKEKECKNDIKCLKNIDELNNKKKIKYMLCESIFNGTKRRFRKTKEIYEREISKSYNDRRYRIRNKFKKRGISKIIDLAIEGKINEVVVAYKDRLARFGYELIEKIIEKYSNGKIIMINETRKYETRRRINEKMCFEIMNVFVAKMNGLRKYKKKNKT